MQNNMSPNPHIQCGVCSCSYHDPSNHCSLSKVNIEPIAGAASGKADDESKCGSYRCRGNC